MTSLEAMPAADAAASVIEAASTADVQTAVREAAARGATLRVAGAGTWLRAGRPVTAPITLSLRRLAGIVEYVPGDLTITVRAGTSLAELDRVTAEHGQWLALDPFGSRVATLGATVATASSGPLAASFGTPRDVVLGIECVTGDGAVIQGGARVVKHVAGFDLVRLMTGAWGTLGVLTTLTLRLRARAPLDATFAVSLSDAALHGWFAAYRAAHVAPLATELLNSATAQALGIGRESVALLRVSGNDEAVTAQERALRDLGEVRAVPSSVWATLAANDPPTATLALRLSQRPARIADLWEQALELARGVPNARVHATVDRGSLRVVLPHLGAEELMARLQAPARIPCTRVFELLPEPLWPRLAPSAVTDPLSQRIRTAFDPKRRLNPGILGEA